jgi:hypothetical protein
MNYYLSAAGAVSLIIAFIHVFAGGPSIATPMRNSPNLSPVVRQTNYYCWHLVTINLLLLAAVFLWASTTPSAWELGLIGTITASGYCLWGFFLVTSTRQSFLHMPQAFMFLPVAVLGALGMTL